MLSRLFNDWKLGSPFGIPLYTDGMWVLTVLWFAVAAALAKPNFWAALPWCLAGVLSIYVFVLLHEWGHVLTAKRLGHKCERIKIMIFGGAAAMGVVDLPPIHQLMIVLNGPLVNFVLSVFALPFRHTEVGAWVFGVNLTIGLFNLLPIYPMDGGRLLYGVVDMWSGKPLLASKVALVVGTVAYVAAGSFFAYHLDLWGVIVLSLLFAAGVVEYSQRKRQLAQKAERVVTDEALIRKICKDLFPDATPEWIDSAVSQTLALVEQERQKKSQEGTIV